jgi:hypothetical protein
MSQRFKELSSFSAVAREFGVSAKVVQRAIPRVECYDLAAAILELDPGNLNALEAVGKIQAPVRRTLLEHDIRSLRDLEGMRMEDLVRLPNIGPRSASVLLRLCAKVRRIGSAPEKATSLQD